MLQTALSGFGTGSAAGQDLAALFNGGEDRFVEPSDEWFVETQQALREEVERVAKVFDNDGGQDAQYWKKHLRWHLLEKNLGSRETIDIDELALVRRWMYSNRPGLEGPFFEKLRPLMDAYLDAAYTHAQTDLFTQFKDKVALARQQCQLLEYEPTDAHAAALGRTVGWLERTRQLPEEVAEVRARASHPNAQVLVTHPLIAGVLDMFADKIEQSIRIVDTTRTPPSGLLQRSRTLYLNGTADTRGSVAFEMIPNEEQAEFSLVYNGEVAAICYADAGPVVFNIATRGPVLASTPIYFGLDDLQKGETAVTPHVRTRLTSVSGRSSLMRRVAQRRASEPASKSQMSAHARAKTVSMLEDQMQLQIAKAINEIRSEVQKTNNSLDGFGDVLAPVQREGAVLQLLGTRSTAAAAVLNVLSGRRSQWGAPAPCPHVVEGHGVVTRVHVSFFNNVAETIMAGKTFTDRYFMNYGKILQAELPLPLMVHSRSARWAVIAAKQRPLVLQIPSANRFHFTLRLQGLEYDGETTWTPAVAEVFYELAQNEYGEYRLERAGELQLRTNLDEQNRTFLQRKLSAFFGPVLDGGGVVIPDGGALGKVAELKVPEVIIDRNWIVLQVTGVEKLFLGR